MSSPPHPPRSPGPPPAQPGWTGAPAGRPPYPVQQIGPQAGGPQGGGSPYPFIPAQQAGPRAGGPPFPFIPVQQTAPPAGLEGPLGPHPWAPPPPRPRSRTALFVAAGVAGFLAVIATAGVLLSALAGSTTPPAIGPDTAPTGQTQVQAIGSWYRGGGRQILGDLAQDFQNAGSATSAEALRMACVGLQGHVEAAQAYAPIPDAEAHRHFATALDRFALGANDCLAGISGTDTRLINKAGDELAAGTRSLGESTRRIASLADGRPI